MKIQPWLLEAQTFLSSSFTDVRFEAASLVEDEIALPSHSNGTDYLYLGFNKLISNFYINVKTANATVNPVVSLEYYNGSSWTSVSGLIDDTKGLSRSGFFQWDAVTDSEETAVNSVSKHWLRLSVDTGASTEIWGVSMLFCDDRDIQKIYPPILGDSEYRLGQDSHIFNHLVARDWVIDELLSKGILKINSQGSLSDITPWDLLKEEQLRLAAAYKCLAHIYFNISDDEEDTYMAKSAKYMKAAESSIRRFNLAVDTNDDGVLQESEKITIRHGRMFY